MKQMHFKVEFLSDVVLQATSNTEGNIGTLDFIPGSVFLGIAAHALYNKVSDSFALFHSGKLCFSDATVMHNEKKTYKMPLSFFHEKLNESELFNHHLIKNFSQFKQLKQKRKGYITEDLEEIEIKYNYAQKSAYDKSHRRSKEKSMFGYEAMKAGTIWEFIVSYDPSLAEDAQKIKEVLTGKKRIGKSKTAQYGSVQITYTGESQKQYQHSAQNRAILYAKSRLALVDENGQPTYDLKYLCEGLTDDNISYEDCQIRTSSFTPFNYTRATKDYERSVINSGSVIVLKNLTNIQLDRLQHGVGAYQSEGFGELMINPPFLLHDVFSLQKEEDKKAKRDQMKSIEEHFDNQTIQCLVNRHNKYIEEQTLAQAVQNFIDQNKALFKDKKMKSQWGTIRSLCNMQDERTIKERIETYISKGVAKDKWDDAKKSALLNAINGSSNKIAFVKLLSIQMPKQTQGAKNAK